MRIAIVWPGIAVSMGDCWRELAKRHEVRIWVEPGLVEQEFNGSELHGLDWCRISDTALPTAYIEIKSFEPDAMLICGCATPIARMAAKIDVKCRKIIQFDMRRRNPLGKILAKFLLWPRLRRFDAAFVPGRRALVYAEWLGFKGRVAMGSTPSGWERFSSVRPAARGFVFVGRFTEEKGIGVLFGAYERYREAVKDPWDLSVVGTGLLFVPDTKGLNVVGFVPPEKMPEVFGRHAALVMPSFWEPWGISAMEAMSAGMMTIATDECGFTGDFEPTAEFVAGDIDGLSKAMVKVHNMTEAERAGESERARGIAMRYSCPRWVEKLENLIS